MSIEERLDRIEQALRLLVELRTVKASYSTGEVAEIVGKAEFTIREHCRLGRIRAFKAASGRGNSPEWRISHEELERFRNEGLLPDPARYHHPR